MDEPVAVDERMLFIRNRWMTQSYGFAWIMAATFFILWSFLDRSWLELLPLMIALFAGALYVTVRGITAGLLPLESLSRSPGRIVLAVIIAFGMFFTGQLIFGTPFPQALRMSLIWIVLSVLGMYAFFALSSYYGRKKERDR